MKEGESRTFTVPLRKSVLGVAKWRRSKRAMDTLRAFLEKHTKSDTIKISRWINEDIWKHGGKNPPGRIKITAKQEKDNVLVELAELSARAKRIVAAEEKAKKDDKKKKLPVKTEAPKKEDSDKKTPAKVTKKAEKKASKKELQKELEAAKAAEAATKKKAAPKITKQQEIAMKR